MMPLVRVTVRVSAARSAPGGWGSSRGTENLAQSQCSLAAAALAAPAGIVTAGPTVTDRDRRPAGSDATVLPRHRDRRLPRH